MWELLLEHLLYVGFSHPIVGTFMAADIVMGGANGQMGPFSKAVPSAKPTARHGAIVLKTLSAMDGPVNEAAVSRVAYA